MRKLTVLTFLISVGVFLVLASPASAATFIASGANSNLSTDPRPFNFTAITGSSRGTVKLTWVDKYNVASGYAIMYGTTPGQYVYGVPFLAETAGTNSFTVGLLNPGTKYYFVLVAEQGANTIFISDPQSARAPGGAIVSAPTPATPAIPGTVTFVPRYVAPGANPNLVTDPAPFNFMATAGSLRGTVNLTWFDKFNVASQFDLVYGTTPGQYIYGVWGLPDFPGILNKFTVGALQSGRTYYFALVAESGGQTVYISLPRRVTAK